MVALILVEFIESVAALLVPPSNPAASHSATTQNNTRTTLSDVHYKQISRRSLSEQCPIPKTLLNLSRKAHATIYFCPTSRKLSHTLPLSALGNDLATSGAGVTDWFRGFPLANQRTGLSSNLISQPMGALRRRALM